MVCRHRRFLFHSLSLSFVLILFLLGYINTVPAAGCDPSLASLFSFCSELARSVEILRRRFSYTVQRTYHHLYEHGYLGRVAMDELIIAEAHELAKCDTPMAQWTRTLESTCDIPWIVNRIYTMSAGTCFQRISQGMLAWYIQSAYDVAHAFIQVRRGTHCTTHTALHVVGV